MELKVACLRVGRSSRPCVRLVQLPLDAVTNNNIVKDPDALKQNLVQLASVGVAGIMGDVWWGIVERAPRQYDFSAYLQIVEMIAGAGLKYQVRAWWR
jgi:beta-amylase